jgi:hypothetical protein
MVRNLTIRLDDDVSKEMEKYTWVNWSAVCRNAITEHIASIKKMDRHDAAVKAHSTRGTYKNKKQTSQS